MEFHLKYMLVLLSLHGVIPQEDDEYEKVAVQLQLADYDLRDLYDEISEATKDALLGHGFEDKVHLEKHRGEFVRAQSQRNFNSEEDIPYDLIRNWTLLTKAGDLLLPEADFNLLVAFHNANEELSTQAKIPCLHENQSDCIINRQGVLDVLATNRNADNLSKTWGEWQEMFVPNVEHFSSVLQVANKAFVPNEEHSVRSYWEMLSEYEGGYTKAHTLWEEVRPLYEKLYNFVKVRLYNYYKINHSDSAVPVYLLGTNFGTEWSNIADVVAPHPYLYHEVLTELKYRNTKDIYKLAETATKAMGLGSLGNKFWSRSNFSSDSCGPHIFSNCEQKFSELLTCDKLGWTEYLNVHEASIDIALRNQDYASLPRREMRFSAVDEALKGLGSIIAVYNLPVYGFIPKNAFQHKQDTFNYKNTALLLIALRFLPKLPYYLLADTWRLEELKFSYGNFTENWWQKRKEFQGVQGDTNLEPDFLGNSFITANKPHLSKFLGVFLQFQIIDYYQKYYFIENGTITDFISSDQNFLSLIHDRPNKNWFDLSNFHYGFGDVSSAALLEYFKPLEEYLDNAPLRQVIFSTTPKPRTTKSTSKPTSKRSRSSKKIAKMRAANETLPMQNDESHKQVQEDTTNVKPAPNPTAVNPVVTETPTKPGSFEKLEVFLGISGLLAVGTVIIVVVRRLKRKQRTNNRRFET